MNVDKALLHKTAHLARLHFDDQQAEAMMADMSNIISWVEKLKEVDTQSVEPLISMSQEVNTMREDVPASPIDTNITLKNAPDSHTDYFRVPKVID